MGGMRTLLWTCVGVTAVLSSGCFSPSKEAEARLASLQAEGQSMDQGLDSVEERLLGNQAMLQQWQEMGRRHNKVTQVHCAAAESHLVAMSGHEERQVAKARARRGKAPARETGGLGGPREE